MCFGRALVVCERAFILLCLHARLLFLDARLFVVVDARHLLLRASICVCLTRVVFLC